MPGDELPPLNTKLTADITGLADGLVKGEALVTAFRDRVSSEFGGAALGQRLGSQIGDGIGRGIEDAKPGIESGGEQLGKDIGDGLSKGVEPGLDDLDTKVKDRTKQTAKDAAGGMSPLLLSAFTLAGTVGPAALLAGTSAAVVGAGALISRSNADIRAEYKTLASDVGTAMTDAVAPLAPAIQASMVQADDAVLALAPVLKQTFADAEPDVSALTKGVTGLATSALPGVRDAIDQSRGIVSGFAGSLPTLGSGVGRFFTGLTTNAQSTQTGIVDFVNVASNALGTLGHVAGSASAALSTDFAAVTPVLNTTLGVINQLASPPVIGGLLGVGAALKLDPAISGGLQKVSNGLTTVAADAEGSTGLLGKAGGAAEKAAGGFGKMADIVGGPWGLAIGAGVGLLGGLVSNMDQSIATVSDFTAAVQADNGVVGASTAAIIQKKLASVDLSAVQTDLGVSQATLIEYAANEKDAQKQVTAAYDAKIASLSKTAGVTQEVGKGVVTMNNASQQEINTLARAKNQVDQVTSAVAGAIKQQNDQSQAYLAATRSAGIFAGMVDTATTALETNANQSAINTVAALHLGAGQDQLAQQLAGVDSQFLLTSSAASAYGTILNADFGKYQSYSDAVAAFTISLKEQSKQLVAGKDATNWASDAGAKNEQVLSAMVTQNYKVAEALLTQTGDQQKANKALQDGAVQIDQVAKNAHFTKTQIDALNMALYGTKNIGDITVPISANTQPARQAVAHLLNDINASAGTIQVYASNGLPGGKALGGWDNGGWVNAPAGTPVPGIVHGQEYVLSQDMLAGRQAIDPRALAVMRAAMTGASVGASAPAFAGARGTSGGGAGVEVVPVAVNVYVDGHKLGGGLNAGVRANVQQFARHNALTGYAANYS